MEMQESILLKNKLYNHLSWEVFMKKRLLRKIFKEINSLKIAEKRVLRAKHELRILNGSR